MITEPPTLVTWLKPGARAICDVPWLGTGFVQSNGEVNFCCYSSAVVGNVNERSFEEIWNGEEMQGIRRSLVAQQLPLQCQTTSCPIYRGDKLNYVVDRVRGLNSFERTGTHDPHRDTRKKLEGSSIEVLNGSEGKLDITLRYRGDPIACDLFVALQTPDNICRFLPDGSEFPVPLRFALQLTEAQTPMHLATTAPRGCLQRPGRYEYCVALFEKESDPNILSNCYWSAVERFVVE